MVVKIVILKGLGTFSRLETNQESYSSMLKHAYKLTWQLATARALQLIVYEIVTNEIKLESEPFSGI